MTFLCTCIYSDGKSLIYIVSNLVGGWILWRSFVIKEFLTKDIQYNTKPSWFEAYQQCRNFHGHNSSWVRLAHHNYRCYFLSAQTFVGLMLVGNACSRKICTPRIHVFLHLRYTQEQQYTVIPELFALLTPMSLFFVVIYYSQYQEDANVCCSENPFKLNSWAFTFWGFFWPWIINNRKYFQNYDIFKCTSQGYRGFKYQASIMEFDVWGT